MFDFRANDNSLNDSMYFESVAPAGALGVNVTAWAGSSQKQVFQSSYGLGAYSGRRDVPWLDGAGPNESLQFDFSPQTVQLESGRPLTIRG